MCSHTAKTSDTLTILSSDTLIDIDSYALSNSGMTVDEIRRHRLFELLDELGSLVALARLLGHNGTAQISQWKTAAPDSKTGKPRKISDDSARRIEAVTGKPRGWMDSPPDADFALTAISHRYQDANAIKKAALSDLASLPDAAAADLAPILAALKHKYQSGEHDKDDSDPG